MKGWGNWPDEMHYDPAQVACILRAKDIKDKEIVNVDKEEQVITIKGSGKEPYVATLDDCTCQDFIIRGKKERPCKHIYRLALELGVLDMPELTDEQYKPKEELAKITKMYKEGKISAKNYAAVGQTLAGLK